MKSSKSQHQMHYGACPKKREARYQTIIKVYQKHYKNNSIPDNSQYWSVCGKCSHEIGKIDINCEPDQLIKYGLIKPYQFYGVEIDSEIHKFNKECDKNINWLLGDFYEKMIEYSNHHNFNPAIVNLDTLLMPKNGGRYLAKIMYFLTTSCKETMLVCNLIMKTRRHVATVKDIVSSLENESCFQGAMNIGKWNMYKNIYIYNGTGNTKTKMGSIILFKN